VQVLLETLVVDHLVKTFFSFLVCQGWMPCFSRRYSLRFHRAHKAGCMRTVTKYRGNEGGIGLHMHTAAATVTSLMLLDILN